MKNNFVKLPDRFVPTKYPGYFWDIEHKKLYSIKVSGELTPLKLQKGGYYHPVIGKIPPHYKVSYKGFPKTYTLDYLNGLTNLTEPYTIKVKE